MELRAFLKLQCLVVLGGKWLPFSLVGGIPMFVKEPPLVVYKWIPKLCGKEAATSDQVVYIISCQGLCAHKERPYPEFQFTATDFVSMAANMSDRGDNMTEANLQADGLVEEPAQKAADLRGTEERTVPPITHQCGPLSRGHLQAVSIRTIVYQYK